MSGVGGTFDDIKSRVHDVADSIKKKIFGTNNEHIDFVMDSFYKLNPNQRNGVIAAIVGVIVIFVSCVFMVYFSRVNSLKSELSDAFTAIDELRILKEDFSESDHQFDQIVEMVQRKTRDLKMKPFFEKLSNQQQVSIEGLSEIKSELAADNPLSEKLMEVVAEMRLPKISVPRLLNFMIEIEKADKYLRVQELQVRGRFGTKLHFDADLKVRGYIKK